MRIETLQRDPEQRKGYVVESNNKFYTPQVVPTENGFDIISEQEGKRGVSIRISVNHSDLYDILKRMCDLSPEKTSPIVHGLSGYLTYKENVQKVTL